VLQTYGKTDVTYDWYAGNSGVVGRSGKFIAAHAAHAGLMMFWAGAFGLFELARYDASIPMGAQKAIVLPHLAGIGIGGVENGVITEPYGIVVICTLHLIFSAVLGAGGLLHSNKFAGDLGDYPENSKPQKFDFEWDDPDKLTFILGHHLIFLGLGAIMFVEWARIHGIYDPAIGSTRQVIYNLDIAAIWNHQFDFLKIDSLEDVMGGHAFLAFLEIIGGVSIFVLNNLENIQNLKEKDYLALRQFCHTQLLVFLIWLLLLLFGVLQIRLYIQLIYMENL